MDKLKNEKWNKFEKILTINYEEKEVIIKAAITLLNFMYEHSKVPEFFELKLTNSENNPFAKDLKLIWAVLDKSKKCKI